jgi:hypothetical protein
MLLSFGAESSVFQFARRYKEESVKNYINIKPYQSNTTVLLIIQTDIYLELHISTLFKSSSAPLR